VKIPDGKLIAETVKPVPEALKEYGHDFRGCISIRQGEKGMASEGFIIIDDGNVLASAFSMMGIMLYQMNALDRMMTLKSPAVKVYAYGEEEKAQVFSGYPDSVIRRPAVHARGECRRNRGAGRSGAEADIV